MGIKKGTRLTECPKDITLKIRLDQSTNDKLLTLCAERKQSKAQVIRDGIEKQYAETKK